MPKPSVNEFTYFYFFHYANLIIAGCNVSRANIVYFTLSFGAS